MVPSGVFEDSEIMQNPKVLEIERCLTMWSDGCLEPNKFINSTIQLLVKFYGRVTRLTLTLMTLVHDTVERFS